MVWPFFWLADGRPLTQETFVKETQFALCSGGIEASSYTGYYFRNGTTMAIAAYGLPDFLIKSLGRWESCAYTLYIHIP